MLLPRLPLLSDQPAGDGSSHGSKCPSCSGPVRTRSADYTNGRLSQLPAHVTVPWWRPSHPFRDVKFQYTRTHVCSGAGWLLFSFFFSSLWVQTLHDHCRDKTAVISAQKKKNVLDMMGEEEGGEKRNQFMRNSTHASMTMVSVRS